MQPELVRKMTVEAVGAFALSFIGVGRSCTAAPTAWSPWRWRMAS